MEGRWYEGLWLGKYATTDEHIIAHLQDGKTYRCRSVQPTGRQVTMGDVNKVTGRQYAPSGTMDPVPATPGPALELHVRDEADPLTEALQPRQVYITRDVL